MIFLLNLALAAPLQAAERPVGAVMTQSIGPHEAVPVEPVVIKNIALKQ